MWFAQRESWEMTSAGRKVSKITWYPDNHDISGQNMNTFLVEVTAHFYMGKYDIMGLLLYLSATAHS